MAPLTRHHLRVLDLVAAHLSAVTTRFALGGSGLLAAHGLTVAVNDLDVLVWRADPLAVAEALAPLAAFEELPKHEPWTSAWLMGGLVGGIRVEIIAGLGYLHGGEHFAIPETTSGEVGSGFPLSALPAWYHLYAWYDPGKADLVAGVVSKEDLEAARLEMTGYS